MPHSLMVTLIQNPAAFALPEVVELFGRAFKSGEPATPTNVIMEMRKLCVQPNVGVLIGWEDAVPKSLVIIVEPTTALFDVPQVYHFYCNGGAGLKNKTVDAMVDWVREKGYTALSGSNWTGRSDKTFERIFRRVGRMDRIGAVYRIQVNEHE